MTTNRSAIAEVLEGASPEAQRILKAILDEEKKYIALRKPKAAEIIESVLAEVKRVVK